MTKKVLIVDDERDITETIKFVLEAAGYECLCAYDGEEGLNAAKELNPDLIILDVMMPKINGFKISRQGHTDFDVNGKVAGKRPRTRRRNRSGRIYHETF